MEKIERLVTATKDYLADRPQGQYWLLSERGGSYSLWQENKDGLRFVDRLPRKRVLWVVPFK